MKLCNEEVCFFSNTGPAWRRLPQSRQPERWWLRRQTPPQNQLLVYNSSGQLMQTVATEGQGGVSGNAGGIEAKGDLVAVVNFGSQNVSIFKTESDGFR
jgi:hypothetical protein